MKSITEILDEVREDMCNNYCKYPNEKGHEDNPDWLFEEGTPCKNCPLNRL